MTMIERIARAMVGDVRYDALPEIATYLQHKSDGAAEWHDRQELHADMRLVLEALAKEAGAAQFFIQAALDEEQR